MNLKCRRKFSQFLNIKYQTKILLGADCTVDSSVADVITKFHTAKKPMGFCCIAPHLAAKLIPGCSVTVGSAGNTLFSALTVF